MKLNSIFLVAALVSFSGASFGADYIYRDLKANTLPIPKCAQKSEALAATEQSYYLDRYAKRFCQTQGYGWGLEAIKSTGKQVCDECKTGDGGTFQCRLEDVMVQCRRLKPGSVGMYPGQS